MPDGEARALAIRNRVVALVALATDGTSANFEPRRVDLGQFRVALWTRPGCSSEMIIWSTMSMLPEGREKVLWIRWGADDFEVVHFHRGRWEGDLFSLHPFSYAG